MNETRLAVALRPLLAMFYCFGIDLNEYQPHKRLQRAYSTVCLALSLFINIYHLYRGYESEDFLEFDDVIYEINRFNFNIINTVFIQVSLYILSWNGMETFWEIVRHLEEFNHFDSQFYGTVRRQSWMILVFIFYSVSVMNIISEPLVIHFPRLIFKTGPLIEI